MYSTRGRPRQITDAQVEAIMEWHRSRKSLRVFAAEIGLKRSTVQYVIERYGKYKQASPEKRETAAMQRRTRMKHLRDGGWM
jgi:hypothetical protein